VQGAKTKGKIKYNKNNNLDKMSSPPKGVTVININNLNQSSVDFIVRIWCNSSDLLTLRFDMNRKVKDALDIKGIEIPFPTTKIINTKG
jgi:small-conductance mechanosensitive channel